MCISGKHTFNSMVIVGGPVFIMIFNYPKSFFKIVKVILKEIRKLGYLSEQQEAILEFEALRKGLYKAIRYYCSSLC